MARSTGATDRAGAPEALTLGIEGMTCAACAGHVERALKSVPGIQSVVVNTALNRADLLLGSGVAWPLLASAVRAVGYDFAQETQHFSVDGMHCAACVSAIEKALMRVPGLAKAEANLALGRVTITRVQGLARDGEIIAAGADAGYGLASLTEQAGEPLGQKQAGERADLARSAMIALLLTLPVFLLEMGGHLWDGLHHWLHERLDWRILAWGPPLLTTLVMFGPGLEFHRKGLPGLLRGRPDMNALVSLGTLAAWGYSIAVVFAPQAFPEANRAVYFESAALIITLILAGRWLEAKSRGEATRAIERLVALQPAEARVFTENGVELRAVSALQPGDRVEILPGDRIPVDGVIITGRSHLDEAMLTGEPMPAEKAEGAGVTGGTVNIDGRLVIRVTRVGQETTLSRIIRLVEAAQGGKLPIQSMIDRVTSWFVPAVLLIAALTLLGWLALAPAPALPQALIHAVSVLIIACPCAMGLATPMSILVGTGRAAEKGILFRDGAALQGLSSIRRIAFDKTGTLTKGKPTLARFVLAPGQEEIAVLSALGALEAQSEHPIAKAVVAHLAERRIDYPEASEVRAAIGVGLTGMVEGRRVEIGARGYMQTLGIAVDALADAVAEAEAAGQGALYVAIDRVVTAFFTVADEPRADARHAIAELTRLGLAPVLISGDAPAATRRMADQLGITEAIGEASPQRKAEEIARLAGEAGGIAYVGDGINDAAALSAADIGIAIGSGTEIAIESADVVLVSGRLTAISEAIALARATMRNIGQNLFWAFGYNVLLIPLAAGLLHPAFGLSLSPAFAAGAMALSSVFVVTNALRLRHFGR